MRQLGREELESKIQYFMEAYRFRTGKDLSLDALKQYIESELTRLESKLIDEAFSNLSHESLRELLLITKIYQKNKVDRKNK